MKFECIDYSTSELLNTHAEIMEELRRREIIRTANNPASDLAEKLFCDAFQWALARNSNFGYDAEDNSGRRVQIKCRRHTCHNNSKILGGLRRLDQKPFDDLAAIIFESNYAVLYAAIIPINVVLELAKFVKHTNSWRFRFAEDLWGHADVKDVTRQLQNAARQL